jgi:hypothetical protein
MGNGRQKQAGSPPSKLFVAVYSHPVPHPYPKHLLSVMLQVNVIFQLKSEYAQTSRKRKERKKRWNRAA